MFHHPSLTSCRFILIVEHHVVPSFYPAHSNHSLTRTLAVHLARPRPRTHSRSRQD
jgi:hypothetical protein